jgi:uncharacterized protein YjbJ (UPF0337 family)
MHKTMEDNPMNQDVFAGQWKQMRGELKSWWGKLADDDFDRIGGQKDKLIGVLQEKYGYARAQAQQEVERRLKAYGAAVAGGLESAEGAIATAATAVAGGLESASSYLQEKEYAEMATDLTALMRRYPVQSLLIGIGLGYVLARLTTR